MPIAIPGVKRNARSEAVYAHCYTWSEVLG